MQDLIIGLIFAGLAMPGSYASASMRYCRTDPILTFSDGIMLTVTSTIDTDDSNVASVVYTLHVPAGIVLVKTIYTAGALGGEEKVQLIDDQNPGVYQIDTLVTTHVARVHVTANAVIMALSAAADGVSGSPLVMTLDTTLPSSPVPVNPQAKAANQRTNSTLTNIK